MKKFCVFTIVVCALFLSSFHCGPRRSEPVREPAIHRVKVHGDIEFRPALHMFMKVEGYRARSDYYVAARKLGEEWISRNSGYRIKEVYLVDFLGDEAEAVILLEKEGEGQAEKNILETRCSDAAGFSCHTKSRPKAAVGFGKFNLYMNSAARASVRVEKSLINTCKLGPAVSLKGSPTVSPVTAAWCAGLFLPP
jgi:hypothetical protein